MPSEPPTAPTGSGRPSGSADRPRGAEDMQEAASAALKAVRGGHTDEVMRLVSAHPDLVDRDVSLGSTLLQYAVEDGKDEVVRALLARGCSRPREVSPGEWSRR